MDSKFYFAYLAPDAEVVTVAVERGFNGSGSQLPDYDEDDDIIILG